MSERKLELERIVVVEECPKCGVMLKRKFSEGDYVGMPGGTCRFCGSQMYVKMIYKEHG